MKYKKCCGASERSAVDPGVARANAAKEADRRLSELMLRFARRRFGTDCLRVGLLAYTGEPGEAVEDAELQLAVPWVMYRFPVPGHEETLAEIFRDEGAARLSPELRDLIDAHLQAWMGVWEVQQVERGVGVSITDLLTGEERFVHEISGSQTMNPRDALLGWVVDSDGISFFGGLHPHGLEPRDADAVVRAIRRLCRVRTRPVKPERLRNPLVQLALISFWRELIERMRTRPAPTITNTDGDPLVITIDHFDVLASDRNSLLSRLRTLPGAEEPEVGEDDRDETVVVITKPGNSLKSRGNTIVGRVVIKGQRLRAESNSARRADALRVGLTSCLGGLVRHRLREETSQTELLRRAMETRPAAGADSQAHSAEATAVVREFKEKHMISWLDEKIPALKGLTPREAAKSPRSMKALELLLREFENHEARLPENERFDIDRLRAELGIPV
jgi:hypothetical protein